MKNETEKRPATKDPVNRSDESEEKFALILGRMVLNFNSTNTTIEQRLAFVPPPKVNPWNKNRETTGMKNETEKRSAKEDPVNYSDESEEKLTLILGHLNVQRIAKKKNELRAFTDNEIDVALLSENFLKASHTFNIPNYITYRTDRNTKPGGETAIMVSKEIKHHSIGTNTTTMETTAVHMHMKRGSTVCGVHLSTEQHGRSEYRRSI
ncbi:hypothetical protein Trydic_g14734 [Trypoxylus dichotomus]